MARLYDAIVKLAPAGASETSTEDAPLFSEDAEALLAPMKAWAERKQAEHEEKQAKRDEGQAKRDVEQAKRDETAGTPVAEAATASPEPQPTDSVAGELERLVDLHARGALSDEQFEAAKSRLLGL